MILPTLLRLPDAQNGTAFAISMGIFLGVAFSPSWHTPHQQLSVLAQSSTQSLPSRVKPDVAREFVEWWVHGAMDFSESGPTSHTQVCGYATTETSHNFSSYFWRDSANLHNLKYVPTEFYPAAMQSDGTAFIHARGNIIDLATDNLSFYPCSIDFTVAHDGDGYRISKFVIQNDASGTKLENFLQTASLKTQPLRKNLAALAKYELSLHAAEVKNYKAAIKYCSEAIALNPQFSLAYRNRAYSRHHSHDCNNAILDDDAALALCPTDDVAYNLRAVCEDELAYCEAAIKDEKQALKLNPWSSGGFNNLGVFEENAGHEDQALGSYGIAVALDPYNSMAYTNRGLWYAKFDRLTESKEDFDQAISINPNDYWSYRYRARVRQMLGDDAGAMKDYEASRARNQNNY